jgi:transposase
VVKKDSTGEVDTKTYFNVKLLAHPTTAQAEHMMHCAQVSNFIYNWTLDIIEFHTLTKKVWDADDSTLGIELASIKAVFVSTLALDKKKKIKVNDNGKSNFLNVEIPARGHHLFDPYMAILKSLILESTQYTDKEGVIQIKEEKRRRFETYWTKLSSEFGNEKVSVVARLRKRAGVLSAFDLEAIWTWEKENPKYVWINTPTVPRSTQNKSIGYAHTAYREFLSGGKGFPKYKNKNSSISFEITRSENKIRLAKASDVQKMAKNQNRPFLTNRIILPSITFAKEFNTLKMSPLPKSHYRSLVSGVAVIGHVTLKYEGNRWWIILNVSIPADSVVKPVVRREVSRLAVGLDIGIGKSNYVTLSPQVVVDGPKITPAQNVFKSVSVINGGKKHEIVSIDSMGNIQPKRYFSQEQKRLARLQRTLARKRSLRAPNTPPSTNEMKLARDIARLHDKVARQRASFQNQIAAELAKKADIIGVESLKVKNMSRKAKSKPILAADETTIAGYAPNGRSSQRGRSRSFADAAPAALIEKIKQQAAKREKEVIQVPTLFPSSKTCNGCGNKKKNLTLSDRTYRCEHEECDYVEDRDINASLNIRDKVLKTGHFKE